MTKTSAASPPCGRPSPKGRGSRPAKPTVDWKAKLQSHLADQGLKNSAQRLRISELILEQPSHFSIQDIVRQVQETHPKIGAATVYRAVRTLCDAGILEEKFIHEGGQAVFELADEDHHDHIVCLDCGQIFEFHEAGIERIQSEISRKLAFREASHRHVIYARCEYGKGKAR
jgi:Fur family ferric uptake transcriptional regulator